MEGIPQLVIVLDLLAGLLVGAHFFIPRHVHKRTDKRVLRFLRPQKDEQDLLQKRSLIWSGIPAGLTFVGIIVWAVLQGIQKDAGSVGQAATSTVLMFVGALAGMGALVLVAWAERYILNWAGRFIPTIRMTNLAPFVWVSSVVLCFLAIFALRIATGVLVPLLVTFALGNIWLMLWMLAGPHIRQFLTFQSGVLARLGLLLFIIGKLILLLS